jgi:hypothetical protein
MAVLSSVLLNACAGFAIHDEGRAKLASEVKESYAKGKFIEIAETDRKNLDVMLTAELAAVNESFRVQVDIAALEIANNSSPMAESYVEAMDRLEELGVKTIIELKNLLKNANGRRNTQHTVDSEVKVLAKYNIKPPGCDNLPDKLTNVPDGLSETAKNVIAATYERYKISCTRLVGFARASGSGRLGDTHKDWLAARQALDTARANEAKLAGDMVEAKAKYLAAAQQAAVAEGTAEALKARIAENAKQISEALKGAADLKLGLENDEKIDALASLLAAAAGGEIDPDDPHVARAAIVAKEIPSLAGDIRELQAKRGVLPVSGLLLALRHQTTLAEGAKQRAALAEERVTILKGKYDAYFEEARRWLDFTNAMCSYAHRAQNLTPAVSDCESLVVTADGQCRRAAGRMEKCVLAEAWKVRLRAQDNTDAKREINKAVAAYLRALAMQAAPIQADFREIDIQHREVLIAKRNALEQWDNLVGVPLDQLDGYYKGGIKPAESADLIVKALGLTAIAIGVSN